jgi:hypothetical protein
MDDTTTRFPTIHRVGNRLPGTISPWDTGWIDNRDPAGFTSTFMALMQDVCGSDLLAKGPHIPRRDWL